MNEPTDDDLRDIARKATGTGYYSGGVKALRAIWDAARAGVVAEEPEWEYGVSYSTPNAPSIDGYRMRSYMKVDSVEKAQEFAALVERPMIQKRTKAVPAGEWVSVPVKQGSDDA